MTHGAQSAARVTGPCFVMGEAAGTAAGLALSAGVAGSAVDGSAVDGSAIDVAELQRRLEDQGAYLGRTAPEQII